MPLLHAFKLRLDNIPYPTFHVDMATFSVIILTAPPPGQSIEAGGPFTKVDGRESLLRAVELFLNRDNIHHVQLAFTADMLEEGKRKFGGHLSFSGVKVLSAGPRWSDQIFAGLEKVAEGTTHVILHDAARPAVSYADIDALLAAAEKNPAVTLATPVRATLAEIDDGGSPIAIAHPPRYMQILTPQAFSIAKLKELAAARREPHASEFTIVKGSPLNMRVGGSGDAGLVGAMLKMLPKPKVKPPSNPFEEAQW
jgi:2-C-methyl-D-erythritol 4-phosphate cytidylyltransferase